MPTLIEKPALPTLERDFHIGTIDADAITISICADASEAIEHAAVDAAGNAWVAWTESDGARMQIWANRRCATTRAWSRPEHIAAAGDASDLHIVVAPAGHVLLVWRLCDGARSRIWAARRLPGRATWDQVAPIQAAGAPDGLSPQLGMDGRGNAVAVWVEFDGKRHAARVNRYSACTGLWATAHALDAAALGCASGDGAASLHLDAAAWDRLLDGIPAAAKRRQASMFPRNCSTLGAQM